ncbi:MAG: DUF1653 domain-containing protein [Lachnospiraceae bacterium]|nr:DUF1653 domain-containing protein [Lachnospiraceae bacterium]
MENRALPMAGEFYRHFKGNLYQIIGRAQDAEDGAEVVVYQALYGEYRWYVRPLEEFLSPVDRNRYPKATQSYRFERVQPGRVESAGKGSEERQSSEAGTTGLEVRVENRFHYEERNVGGDMVDVPEEECVREELLRFLDAETAGEKLEVLREISRKMDEELLTTIELSLDLMPDDRESLERRLDLVERTLEKRVKYEGGRLR